MASDLTAVFAMIRAEKLAAPVKGGSIGLPQPCPKCGNKTLPHGEFVVAVLKVRWTDDDVLFIACVIPGCGYKLVEQRN